MVRVVYDSMEVDNLHNHGIRSIINAGPMFEDDRVQSRAELESFYFHLLPSLRLNLGAHALIGQTTSDSLESQYFLGGFESVRGLPDGVMFGNRAGYVNLEARHLFLRLPYMWFQSAAFTDIGGAGQSWMLLASSVRKSAGIGLRVAVPQIYRLIFRVDYAWSLDDSGSSGVSLGMNQFFQPYKPL